jgi:acetyltransferase-like isoleucine patch superfamily enzyme
VKTADLCREHGICAATFYGWKQKFRGMEWVRNRGQVSLATTSRADRFVIISECMAGDGVILCPGLAIGERSVAGASSVVPVDVPPFTWSPGVPARPIRHYDAVRGTWIKF